MNKYRQEDGGENCEGNLAILKNAADVCAKKCIHSSNIKPEPSGGKAWVKEICPHKKESLCKITLKNKIQS